MLKTELESYKKKFEQLSGIHSQCRSQKENVSVAIRTTDDEVTFTVLLASYVHKFIGKLHM